MEKLFSHIVGTPVIDDDFRHPITRVKDVIIDPESGKLIALVVDSVKNLVIAPIDILSWGDAIRIPSHDAIAEANEIFRVKEVLKKGIRIFGNRVESKNGEFIGNVADFSIDSNDLTLKKLYTAKTILGLLRYDSRLISAKNIEEILPDKIIVTENLKAVKEKKRAVSEDLAVS